MGYTPEKIHCLRRISYTKLCDKLIKIYPETKLISGQDILDQIQEKNGKYKERTDKSLFQHISRRLQMQKGMVTKEEIIYSYMEELKNELMRNLGEDAKLYVSMATTSSNNEFQCFPEKDNKIDIDQLIQNIEQQAQKEILQNKT